MAGRSIDTAAVGRFAAPAALVIAHNAAVDRRFLERFCETFTTKPRACSMSQIDWASERHEGARLVLAHDRAPASEDFGCFGTAGDAPSVFWFVGGADPDVYAKAKAEDRINELPVNHSPHFAPVLHPTLETSLEAMVAAALAWNAV